MSRFKVMCVLVTLMASNPALASNYLVSFRGTPLAPVKGGQGVPGVSFIRAKWYIPSLPNPGNCASYPNTIVFYSDGVNSLQRLYRRGYQFVANGGNALSICASAKTGKLTSGQFDLELVTNGGTGTFKSYSGIGSVGKSQAISSSVTHCSKQTTQGCSANDYFYDQSTAPVKKFGAKIAN